MRNKWLYSCLLWTCLLSLAWAKRGQEFDPKKVQLIIENELVYPSAIYGILSYPPQLSEQMDLLDEWKRKGWVSDSNEEIKVNGVGTELEIIRNYPSYKISGIKVTLCKIGIHVEEVRLNSKGVEARGKKVILNKTEHIKSRKSLGNPKACEEEKVNWLVKRKGESYEVEEQI